MKEEMVNPKDGNVRFLLGRKRPEDIPRNAMGWPLSLVNSPGCGDFPPFETGRPGPEEHRPDPFADFD